MEFVDVFVNRRAVGHAYMRDDHLEGVLTPRGSRRTRLTDCEGCAHERVIGAFAHRRSRDEHWPIAYCLDCYAIVAGLDPLVRVSASALEVRRAEPRRRKVDARLAEARSAASRRAAGLDGVA